MSRMPPVATGGRGRGRGRRAEEPLPDVLRHGPEPLVADRLAVDGGHVRYFMAHNEVSGGLVLRLVGHGPEGVP